MDFEYYRQERYLAEYSGDLLSEVNARIDWDLMGWFGYVRREAGR
jgi:hypothetical protein